MKVYFKKNLRISLQTSFQFSLAYSENRNIFIHLLPSNRLKLENCGKEPHYSFSSNSSLSALSRGKNKTKQNKKNKQKKKKNTEKRQKLTNSPKFFKKLHYSQTHGTTN